VADPKILKRGRRHFISPVLIYRKFRQRSICFLHGKGAFWKKCEPIGGGAPPTHLWIGHCIASHTFLSGPSCSGRQCKRLRVLRRTILRQYKSESTARFAFRYLVGFQFVNGMFFSVSLAYVFCCNSWLQNEGVVFYLETPK